MIAISVLVECAIGRACSVELLAAIVEIGSEIYNDANNVIDPEEEHRGNSKQQEDRYLLPTGRHKHDHTNH
jgi:hypothetical protein